MPVSFKPLFDGTRYKVYFGGRGAGKSWAIAQALIIQSLSDKLLILCTREYQTSITDSVYRLLTDQIYEMGLSSFFDCTLTRIKSVNGSEFIFKGLHHNIAEIKSTEGVDRVWVEEAQSVSTNSWEILIPTIRKEKSEIWISFNTGEVDDPTYTRFVLNPPPDAVVKKVGWQDNPYFPDVLEKERLYMQRVDPEAYEHVWEGEPRRISDACVLKGKYRIETFETPENVQFYFGSDFGFSQDPLTLERCFIQDNKLYIDYEAWGIGVELDDIPALYDTIPDVRNWTIRADDSRPETINYIKKKDLISRALLKHGEEMIPRQTKKDRLWKELLGLESLKSLSSTSVANILPRKQSFGDTRQIDSLMKFCQSFKTVMSTAGMQLDMPVNHLSKAA